MAENIDAIEFCYVARNIAVYTGVGKEIEGRTYHASRVYVHPHKLDGMPPYQDLGGVTWETIHGLLDEAKKKADWKPIWEAELLDLVFEFELARRLQRNEWSSKTWDSFVTRRAGTNYATVCHFWAKYGWEPFRKLLTQLHEDDGFRPTFDQSTFAYQMSLYVGENVAPFFEERGWSVSAQTKRRIHEELQFNHTRREGKE